MYTCTHTCICINDISLCACHERMMPGPFWNGQKGDGTVDPAIEPSCPAGIAVTDAVVRTEQFEAPKQGILQGKSHRKMVV